jgi:hypothetical protein
VTVKSTNSTCARVMVASKLCFTNWLNTLNGISGNGDPGANAQAQGRKVHAMIIQRMIGNPPEVRERIQRIKLLG